MAEVEVVWVETPEAMVAALEAYGQKVLAAVKAVAEFIATKMQNEARQNASWTDRTGNARSGLFGAVETESAGAAAEAIVTIYLSHGHTIEYGKFLEVIGGGKYAIIMRTVEANLPELKGLLDGLFR